MNKTCASIPIALMLILLLVFTGNAYGIGVKQTYAAPLQDGNMQVWAIDVDNHLWSCWQEEGSSLTKWTRFDMPPTTPIVKQFAAAQLWDGRLQLWAIDADDQLWTMWRYTPDPRYWTYWYKFQPTNSRVKEVVATRLPNMNLKLWVLDKNNQIWSCERDSTQWSNWARFDTPASGANHLAVTQVDYGIYSFTESQLWAVDNDNKLLSNTLGANGWTGWANFSPAVPTGVEEVTAVRKYDENERGESVKLWAISSNLTTLWMSRQKTSNGPISPWNPWIKFDKPSVSGIKHITVIPKFVHSTTEPMGQGDVQLLAVGDGYQLWSSELKADGSWTPWTMFAMPS